MEESAKIYGISEKQQVGEAIKYAIIIVAYVIDIFTTLTNVYSVCIIIFALSVGKLRGINSVVECHLAKVKVASPNLVSRSIPENREQRPETGKVHLVSGL